MGPRIHCSDVAGVTVVRLLESNLLESHGLEETFRELLEVISTHTGDELVLDLAPVQSMSGAGLGKLLELKRRLHARGARLTLENVGDEVYQVFEVTNLSRYFGLDDEQRRPRRSRVS